MYPWTLIAQWHLALTRAMLAPWELRPPRTAPGAGSEPELAEPTTPARWPERPNLRIVE